jgi:hypothetical protein
MSADIAKTKELKAEVLALSANISKAITIDNKAGTATAGETVYVDNLPEGLTQEVVKSVSDYNTTFVAASTHAFGVAAVDAFKANKKAERFAVEIPMIGKDNLSLSIDRTRESHNPQDPTKKITTYGNVTASLKMKAGDNSGQFKLARTTIKELAFAAYGK